MDFQTFKQIWPPFSGTTRRGWFIHLSLFTADFAQAERQKTPKAGKKRKEDDFQKGI